MLNNCHRKNRGPERNVSYENSQNCHQVVTEYLLLGDTMGIFHGPSFYVHQEKSLTKNCRNIFFGGGKTPKKFIFMVVLIITSINQEQQFSSKKEKLIPSELDKACCLE